MYGVDPKRPSRFISSFSDFSPARVCLLVLIKVIIIIIIMSCLSRLDAVAAFGKAWGRCKFCDGDWGPMKHVVNDCDAQPVADALVEVQAIWGSFRVTIFSTCWYVGLECPERIGVRWPVCVLVFWSIPAWLGSSDRVGEWWNLCFAAWCLGWVSFALWWDH